MFGLVIILLALGILAFLVLRRVRGGSPEQPPKRVSRPLETKASPNRYGGIAILGSPVAEGLDAIAAADEHFDVGQFIDGARSAYEMVVTAYANGERRTLTNLLAPEVYEGFEDVIRERIDR